MRIGVMLVMLESQGMPPGAIADPETFRILRGFELPQGDSTIGRGDCDIKVSGQYGGVSRRHAAFNREGDRVTVSDIGSSYGTFVEDVRITGPTVLALGQEVRLADLERDWAAYRLVAIV